MKTIQLRSNQVLGSSDSNDINRLLRAAGVKRIHDGWYTAHYNGVDCDASTITSAYFNHAGKIRFDTLP